VFCKTNSTDPSGTVVTSSSHCLLNNNYFNSFYFLTLWYYYVASIPIAFLALVYHIIKIMYQTKTSPDGMKAYDHFFLSVMRFEIARPLYKDFFIELKKKIDFNK